MFTHNLTFLTSLSLFPACPTRSQLRCSAATITSPLPDAATFSVPPAPGRDGLAPPLGGASLRPQPPCHRGVQVWLQLWPARLQQQQQQQHAKHWSSLRRLLPKSALQRATSATGRVSAGTVEANDRRCRSRANDPACRSKGSRAEPKRE